MSDPILVALRRRYRSAGIATRIAVVSKFVGDPVYRALLESGILPDRGTVLDLGCGRGILLAAIAERRSGLKLHGIEVREGDAAIAREALGRAAVIETADLSSARLPPCDLAAILDVFHYLDPAIQDDLLARTIAALRPGGVLVVREADAAAGLRFRAVSWSESIAAALRGDRGRRFHYRSAREWGLALEAMGLATEIRPMGRGTPFANVLVTARKR
jgi:SAM-dependent methyltransferase